MNDGPAYNRRADSGARILVVDDDALVRRNLRTVLERGLYQVETVAGGAEALERLPVFEPDLVLLDIIMPGMDGLETCRRIRELPGRNLLPVIFLTSDDRPETHSEAFRVKGDDFLRKPIFSAELIVRIRSLMRLKRLQAEVLAERDALLDAQKQTEQLFGFIVHDLKNPLTAIQVGLELMGNRGDIPGAGQVQVQRILETARGMGRMVQDILDISRAEQTGLDLQLSRFSIRQWLPGLLREVEYLAQRLNQTMTWDCPEDLELEADQELLRRVILNLLDNALKYSSPGSRTRVEAGAVANGIQVRVIDEGPGIPESQRQAVFDKFMRLESDSPRARSSSGLGLTFCQVVSEAHGGRIWVEQNRPRGSVFILELPAACGS